MSSNANACVREKKKREMGRRRIPFSGLAGCC